MKFTRPRVALGALLLLLAGGGIFLHFEYKRIAVLLAREAAGQLSRKLGRQIRFDGLAFSPLKGIQLKNPCVSRRPDFSKGEFFCAARAVVRPRFSSLLRRNLYFSSVVLEKPVIKVRESGGAWDFADLLALLPETSRGLHLTWNANRLVLKDAELLADLETSGLSLALEGLDLELDHYSSYGGNYGLNASGGAKTALNGKLLSASFRLRADANFEYGGLSSSKGSFRVSDAAYGAMTLARAEAEWELFNLRRPLAEKNYTVSVSAGDLLLPAQESAARDGVARALTLFSAAMGKPAPKVEDLEMERFSASFRLNDSRLSVGDAALRTNFLDADASLAIDGPAKTAEAALSAAIGPNKIKMTASGPMDKPVIRPLLSDTLSAKFREALADAERALLKVFPVTGE